MFNQDLSHKIKENFKYIRHLTFVRPLVDLMSATVDFSPIHNTAKKHISGQGTTNPMRQKGWKIQ